MPIPPRLTLVLVLLAIRAAAPAAQKSPSPDYLKLVEAYRAGDSAAIVGVGQLTLKQITAGVKDVIKRDAVAGLAHHPRRRVRAAAMLHLEQALVLERDVTQAAFDRRVVHEDAAATLVRDLCKPSRGRRPTDAQSDEAFLLAWTRFRAAHDMGRGQYRAASADVELGLREAGEDAELLLAKGALHELAWRMVNEEARTVDRWFAGDLAVAERALQSAVRQAPALDEALVRLGRVQAKAGRPADAVRTLAGLTAPDGEPGFVYLARLFEGDAYAALHDTARAKAAYAAATDAMPGAQSARIALAHLLFMIGARDDAADRVVELAAGARVGDARDPWVIYRGGVAWRGPRYLDVLRAMVRQ